MFCTTTTPLPLSHLLSTPKARLVSSEHLIQVSALSIPCLRPVYHMIVLRIGCFDL